MTQLSIEQIAVLYNECMIFIYDARPTAYEIVEMLNPDIGKDKLVISPKTHFLNICGNMEPIIIYYVYNTESQKFVHLNIRGETLSDKISGNCFIDIDNF